MKEQNLYRLDNAAKIYPAAMTKTWNATYRVAAYMKEELNISNLKQAVIDLAPRFPTYYVQLHKGPFWDYLKTVYNYDIVSPEKDYPCRPMEIGNTDKPMIRVLYKEKRISVEFFHSITDGTGAMIYLKTLVARYLELQGYSIEKTNGVLDINEAPRSEEIEDSFQKIYSRKRKASRKEDDAYQFLPEVKENYLQLTTGFIPIDELKKVSKEKYGCTITEYLVAVYAYSFLQQYLKDKDNKTTKNPIKISVPANLRPFFDSETLRNFAMFANIDINPQTKNYKFEDVLNEVKYKMVLLLEKETLHNMASQNVAEEKMLISRVAPNFLKKPFMKAAFNMYGERKFTSPFSNIGLIKIPESMKQHVDAFQAVIGETAKNRIYCAVAGIGNVLTVSFSSISENSEIQNFFFGFVSSEGVNLKIVKEA